MSSRGGQASRSGAVSVTRPRLSQAQFASLLTSSRAFYDAGEGSLREHVRRGTVNGREYIVKEGGQETAAQERGVQALANEMGVAQYFVPVQSFTQGGHYYSVSQVVPGRVGGWDVSHMAKYQQEEAVFQQSISRAVSPDERMKLGLVNYLLGDGDRSPYNTILTPGGGLRQIDLQSSFMGGHTLTPDVFSALFRTGGSYQANDTQARHVQGLALSSGVHSWLRENVVNHADTLRSIASRVFGQHYTADYWYNASARALSSSAFNTRLAILQEVARLPNPTLGDLSRIAHEDRWDTQR